MYRDARNPPRDIAGFDPEATAGDSTFDPNAARKALDFFNKCLVFTKGPKAGEPFRLESWQSDVVRALFGYLRPDGTRRFRHAMIAVARKNGKSTWVAGMANYVLFCDPEEGAECYCAASDREQSSLVFNTAATMIRKSFLAEHCKIRDSTKRIVYGSSFLRAIPANEGGSHGFDSHLIIGDELHAWPGREFHDVLHTSTGARTQPLEIYITTAGYDRNSICYEKWQYARQVRDGQIVDDAFLPALFETADEADWTDEEVWRQSNPNLGVSISVDYLRRECQKAQETPAYENTFRRLHLNQWTSQESRWLQMEKWRACEVLDEPLDPKLPAFGALDLSSKVDVTAWMTAQRTANGWKLRGHYFIPEGRMQEAEKRDRVPYSAWVRRGIVTATPGDAIDYQAIRSKVLADAAGLQIAAIGFDPWNAIDMSQQLEEEGLTMVEVRQGMASMSEPCKELERCVIEGTLDHGGDPVLAWMAENVQVKTDENGNIRPVKPDHAGSAKRIDGIVAAVMAIGVGMVSEPQQVGGFCIL